jgi:hypothetical protein
MGVGAEDTSSKQIVKAAVFLSVSTATAVLLSARKHKVGRDSRRAMTQGGGWGLLLRLQTSFMHHHHTSASLGWPFPDGVAPPGGSAHVRPDNTYPPLPPYLAPVRPRMELCRSSLPSGAVTGQRAAS